jgi:allophanate hydrolase
MRADGLPFGIQFLAPAGHDDVVATVGAIWCGEEPPTVTEAASVLVAVAGAHLTGQPLNHELLRRGARLVNTTRTAPGYRMFLVDGPLPRPGLTKLPRTEPNPSVGPEVEVWAMPARSLGEFATTIAPPLAIGPIDLSDGSQVLGFVCTGDAVRAERDITEHGGWRAYLAAAARVRAPG